ncbi:hypothetical protein TI39_contig4158g00003 [Zymoseptoria brevis]|uniref:Uncharacterized protein n=1 Tax=Zymoseptoria brevis TaxID=1047168 RepID=A0A0F4GBP4_9PEZI|nr:hypothetical protein TI39_contig4158g00003 [Zymoseptoria brevis]
MLRDTSNSIRRWRNSQGSSSGPTTPVGDRNLTVKSAYFNATPTGNTTFLPTLHSTPPMPTFQKPDMQCSPTTPTALPIRKKKENGPPRIPTPVGDSTTITTSFSSKPYMPIVTPARGLPSGATTTRKVPHSKASDFATDRVQHTESLPEPWTTKQDRLVCVQDAKGRSLEYIVKKLREECPEFEDQILTTEMVDKRLRILDFDLTWNGWSEGLKEAQVSAARRERKSREKAKKGDEAEVSLESCRSGDSEKGSRVGL